MTTNYTEKALDIIHSKGVEEWLKVRDAINLEALNQGYCIDIEGCCEEDRCDCWKYRGLTMKQITKKLNKAKQNI